MALDDDIRILSGVPLFEGFTQEQLRLLAFGAENMRIAAGRELYREGAPAECAFVLARGTVNLVRDGDGHRTVLAVLTEGAVLGEFALISDTLRPTGAVAATDVELVRLNRKLFRRILEEYPNLAAALHDRIAGDLRDMIARIGGLAPRLRD